MSDRDHRALYRAVADLYTQNIDQGFLSTLGPGFLNLLYRAIDENPERALIVAYEDGAVCGFIAGTVNLQQVYLGLLRRCPALVVARKRSDPSKNRLLRMKNQCLTSALAQKPRGGLNAYCGACPVACDAEPAAAHRRDPAL
jgi:hypothetical protein